MPERIRVARYAAVVAVLTVCVVLLSAASAGAAPAWLVEGTPLAGSEAVKTKAETAFTLTAKLTGGAAVVILCTKVSGSKGKIIATREASSESVIFEECKVDEPTSCKVPSTIKSAAVTAELFDEGTSEVWNLFKPTSGTNFAVLEITNCAGEGRYNVAGTVCAKITEPGVSAVIKLGSVGVPLEACKLQFGVNPATPEGTAETELAGTSKGKKWTADF